MSVCLQTIQTVSCSMVVVKAPPNSLSLSLALSVSLSFSLSLPLFPRLYDSTGCSAIPAELRARKRSACKFFSMVFLKTCLLLVRQVPQQKSLHSKTQPLFTARSSAFTTLTAFRQPVRDAPCQRREFPGSFIKDWRLHAAGGNIQCPWVHIDAITIHQKETRPRKVTHGTSVLGPKCLPSSYPMPEDQETNALQERICNIWEAVVNVEKNRFPHKCFCSPTPSHSHRPPHPTCSARPATFHGSPKLDSNLQTSP